MDKDLKYQLENDYPRIPMGEIDDEARLIAVAWGDQYMGPGINMQEKVKLASDIMNYARRVGERSKLPEPVKVLRAGDFIIKRYSGPNDPRIWLENMQGEAVEVRLEDLWEKLFEKGPFDDM